MPLEGTENTTGAAAQGAPPATNTTDQNAQNTPDAAGNNTGASATPNAGTDNAQNNQAQTDKTFSQADLDRIVANRVKSGVKAELKRLTGDTEGVITVESLQQQLNEERTARQRVEARQEIRTVISDAKLNVPATNHAAIEELVHSRLEYGTDGKPTNLADAIASVKSLAPTLFTNAPTNINAGDGRKTQNGPVDMNSWVRELHAKRA
jgi:hypothetical protein